MLWPIYAISALAVFLCVYSLFQFRFERLEDEYRRTDTTQSGIYKIIEPAVLILAAYNKKLNTDKLDNRYKRKLINSGNPLHLIPVEFFALKEISAIGGALFGFFIVLSMGVNPVLPLLACIGSFFLPDLWLREMTKKRKHDVFISLPFTMDLLTLSVEAGLTFIAAIEKVVEKGQPGPLRDEFDKLLQDLRLGVARRDALTGIAERTDMYEIRSFSSALIQADKLGAPLGETLRTQADLRRTERYQKAEKLAQEAPVKMLFPLLLFIFPAVFIVILGPVMLKFLAEGM